MATKNANKAAEVENVAAETEIEEVKKDERVPLDVPRGQANDEPNVFISVNGIGFLLPKGKRSMVPPYVKAEYERSVAAQTKMDEHVSALLEVANTPLP